MVKSKNNIKKTIFNTNQRGVDRVLIFRFFRLLHGRFWGIGSIVSILLGATIGYLIRPDMFRVDGALSELGTDVRTAPFFAGSMFFAAYSLWRWRTYIKHTLKTARPEIPLVSLTILGLYMIALMPITWEVWPHRLHNIGVAITGISMSATVLTDSILSRTRKSKKANIWRMAKLTSFLLILVGATITALSVEEVNKLQLMLLGEGLMFLGYANWIILKVYIGEGTQSTIGRIVKKLFV
jgi:hypothetical protein